MSTELHELETLKGTLQITEFCGPNGTPMLQIGQGCGIGPDEPGFIQLTMPDVAALVPLLVGWMRDESNRRAEMLRKQIAKDKLLEKTIFSEAAECARFIEQFEIPALCASQLCKVTK